MYSYFDSHKWILLLMSSLFCSITKSPFFSTVLFFSHPYFFTCFLFLILELDDSFSSNSNWFVFIVIERMDVIIKNVKLRSESVINDCHWYISFLFSNEGSHVNNKTCHIGRGYLITLNNDPCKGGEFLVWWRSIVQKISTVWALSYEWNDTMMFRSIQLVVVL